MRYWIVAALVVLVALVAYALWPKEVHTIGMPTQTVLIGTTTFAVDIADTETSRELGLGQRASLPQGQGMLFIFDMPNSAGIWMKDMQFPLDILWAREDGTIITIAHNIATSTYPEAFYPKTPDAKYVLEVNAGAATSIAEGDKMMVQ